jgi:hypothetical protein
MKTFQQLDIYLKGNKPIFVIEQLEAHLINNWLRDKSVEDKNNTFDETPLYCFKRLPINEITNVSLWLMEKKEGILSVSNILPTEIGQLSYDEYNTIISEFYEKIVKRLEDKISIEAKLTSPEIRLKDFLSIESFKLLSTFSSYANKSTGYLFSLDQQRWFSFILSSHKNHETLDSTLLERFLQEEGWSYDWAVKLSNEYELARNLLNYYQKDQENVAHPV